MKRIVIIGTSASGKTTLAAALAAVLQIPHIELDALHWQPGWVANPKEEFIRQAELATRAPAWVVDGNYSKGHHVIWPRADTLIWLDYAFPLIWGRLFSRTLWRLLSQEECCNGNRETWRQTLSRDSLFVWVFQSHWRHRRRYEQALVDPALAHMCKLRFRSPQATAEWLKELKQ
jgi:adenylate kinase family enzyme